MNKLSLYFFASMEIEVKKGDKMPIWHQTIKHILALTMTDLQIAVYKDTGIREHSLTSKGEVSLYD